MKVVRLVVSGLVAASLMLGVAMTPTWANISQDSTVVSASAASEIKAGLDETGQSGGPDMSSIIKTVVNTMLFIVGLLAVIMIIFSGIRYITAHGDKAQLESAKNTLIYSVVGLIIAIVAYALVNWVLNLFSTNSGSGGTADGGTVTGYVQELDDCQSA